jgi:hypothetical protein
VSPYGTPPTPPFSIERRGGYERSDRAYDDNNRDLFALD